MGAGLDRGEVLNLLLVLVGVVHVAGLEGRGVGVGVLPLQSGINVGLTVVGCVALWKTKWQQERLKNPTNGQRILSSLLRRESAKASERGSHAMTSPS